MSQRSGFSSDKLVDVLVGFVISHVDYRPSVRRPGYRRAFVGKAAQGRELFCCARKRVDFDYPAVVLGRVIEVAFPSDQAVFFVYALTAVKTHVAVKEMEIFLTGKYGLPRGNASGTITYGADCFPGARYGLVGNNRYPCFAVDAPVVSIILNQAPVPVLPADPDDTATYLQHFPVYVISGLPVRF